MKFNVFLIAIFVFLNSLSPALAISEAEFKSKVVGKTWKWKTNVANGTVKYFKSGKVNLSVADGKVIFSKSRKKNVGKKGFKDSGRWRWKRGEYCTRYKNVRNGKERCFDLSPNGKNYKTSWAFRLYR